MPTFFWTFPTLTWEPFPWIPRTTISFFPVRALIYGIIEMAFLMLGLPFRRSALAVCGGLKPRCNTMMYKVMCESPA